MIDRAPASWTPAQLRREIRAWIDYYAHALPRPEPALDLAIERLAGEALRRLSSLESIVGRPPPPAMGPARAPLRLAAPEPLTAAMILDALDHRLAETLGLDAGAPGHLAAALALDDAIHAIRTEDGLAWGPADLLPPAAWEAATDLVERALADRADLPHRARAA